VAAGVVLRKKGILPCNIINSFFIEFNPDILNAVKSTAVTASESAVFAGRKSLIFTDFLTCFFCMEIFHELPAMQV
jgi:hypothetical protein